MYRSVVLKGRMIAAILTVYAGMLYLQFSRPGYMLPAAAFPVRIYHGKNRQLLQAG